MIQFPVSPEKQNALLSRMQKLQILESDLEESFTTSRGKGGQNVNKVATAVRLIHRKTGLEVKCSIYRTQGLNRYKARVILCEKIELQSAGPESKAERKIQKLRKNKDRNRRRQKKRELDKERADEKMEEDS